jgi:FKBP-type peptidyl-prolyl cis-trans isomerase
LAAPEVTDAPKFYKTASGVKVQEVAPGRGGQAAQMGDAVLFDYVLRRSNGYFIYATVEGVSFQPRDVPVAPVYYKVGDPTLIPGLNEVLVGMEPGSKRRALIPPALGYTSQELQPQPPTFATKRQLVNHSQEPLIFEVQMLKVNP